MQQQTGNLQSVQNLPVRNRGCSRGANRIKRCDQRKRANSNGIVAINTVPDKVARVCNSIRRLL